MAQYRVGTVNVTNGSAAVVGVGTSWLANVQPGDLFAVQGSNLFYEVASVADDTHLTLTANWAGLTMAGRSYALHRDFTPNFNIPYPTYGDIETNALFERAVKEIDAVLQGLNALNLPVLVDEGGTGAQSFTQGGLVVGSGAMALRSLGPLAKGTILVGQGGTADPVLLAVGANGRFLKADSAAASGVSWEPVAALLSINGVRNDGSNIDLVGGGAITVTPDDGANTVTIGETHSARTDNPHAVTKAQVGLGSVTNALQLVASSNLSDLTDTAAARTNIGLGSVIDAVQLTAANNLSDLTDAAAARANIGLGDVLNATQLVRTNNLSDLTSTSAARTNIGLGNVANELQLVAADNLADLTNVSTARTNLGLGTMATQNASAVTITGGTASLISLTTSVSVTAQTSVITDTVSELTTNAGVTIDGVLLKDGGATFSSDVSITGTLTVTGTINAVNSTVVDIGDSIIVLNADETGTPSQDGGIEVERGTSTNVQWVWDEAADAWRPKLGTGEAHLGFVLDPTSADHVGDRGYNDDRYLQRANNLSDLTDASAARTSLGLGNVANALQLIASNNLSDLTNTATARTNIGLGNVANTLQLAASNNLSDLTNAALARTNIGLGNVLNAVQLVASSNLSDVADAATARTNIGAASATALSSHIANTSNPHAVTAAQVGAIATINTIAPAGTNFMIAASGRVDITPGTNTITITTTAEANTAANVGATGANIGGVFRDKTSETINLRRIRGTGAITLTENGDYIDIGAVTVPDGTGIRVTVADTTPDYLASTLVAGTGIALTVLNPGANETLRVSFDTATPLTFAAKLTLQSVLGLANLASDPVSASNGDVYYNTTSHTIRAYQNGAWAAIAGGGDTGNFTFSASTLAVTSGSMTLNPANGIATIGPAAGAGMARLGLVNSNRNWTISNYGTDYAPNGALAIADETAAAVRLIIDTSGVVAINTLGFIDDTDTGIGKSTVSSTFTSLTNALRLHIDGLGLNVFQATGGVNIGITPDAPATTTSAGRILALRGGVGGSTSGNGGALALFGGTPVDGNGGSVSITGAAGVGTDRNGGNVVLTAGVATGTGTPGDVILTAGTGGLVRTNNSRFRIGPIAGAPASPQNGEIWYDGSTNRFMLQEDSASRTLGPSTPTSTTYGNIVAWGGGDGRSLIDGGTLAYVAYTGQYGDLLGRPSLAAVATSGAYADLTGRPTLAAVATSGAYNDLTGTPAPDPIGSILISPTATPPTGYLRADGSVYSKATYAALAAAIGDVPNNFGFTNTPTLVGPSVSTTFGIAFGGGLWVGMADDGSNTPVYSSDGYIWTKAATVLPSMSSPRVFYVNSRFFIFATGATTGNIYTSTDGITWTTYGVLGGQFTSIAWNGSVYCMVGTFSSSVRIITSPDLTTWTLRTSAIASGTGTGIVWSSTNSLFVSITNQSSTTTMVQTSPDGITWTARTTPTGSAVSGIYTNDNGSVILLTYMVGNTSLVRSTDGVNWANVTHGFGSTTLVIAWQSTQFVAAAANSSTPRTSTDGSSWSAATSTVTFGSTTIIAGTVLGGLAAIMTYVTGVITLTDISSSSSATTLGTFTRMYYLNGVYIAMWGQAANSSIFRRYFYTSTDGLSWTRRDFSAVAGANVGVSDCVYFDSKWWFLLETSTTIMWTTDFVTFNPVTIGVNNATYLATNGTSIIAYANSNAFIHYSTNGTTWNTATLTGWATTIRAVVAFDGHYIMANALTTTLYRSVDNGATWNLLTPLPTAAFAQFMKATSRYIVLQTGNNEWYISYDGTKWTSLATPATATVTDFLIIKDTIFVLTATGTNRTISILVQGLLKAISPALGVLGTAPNFIFDGKHILLARSQGVGYIRVPLMNYDMTTEFAVPNLPATQGLYGALNAYIKAA